MLARGLITPISLDREGVAPEFFVTNVPKKGGYFKPQVACSNCKVGGVVF